MITTTTRPGQRGDAVALRPALVIYGPQGCGKTRNAGRLASLFGATRIVDEWNGQSPLPAGSIAFSNAPGPETMAYSAISFAEAIEALRERRAHELAREIVTDTERLRGFIARDDYGITAAVAAELARAARRIDSDHTDPLVELARQIYRKLRDSADVTERALSDIRAALAGDADASC